jgi:hypothetical protein
MIYPRQAGQTVALKPLAINGKAIIKIKAAHRIR